MDAKPIERIGQGLFIFGCGYVGTRLAKRGLEKGLPVWGTSRDAEKRERLTSLGITAIDPDDTRAMGEALIHARSILITAAPDQAGCPGARAIIPALAQAGAWPDWIGYLSSTAVYGDRDGGWVFEGDPLNAATLEGARRVKAEAEWLQTGQGMGLCVQIFRLPSIYGPDRSALDRVRSGTARRVIKPGQVFNRVHVDDLVSGLEASMVRPSPGGIYNLADDEPSAAHVLTEWAADALGVAQPPLVEWTDPSVTESMRRFYLDSKRVSNARAKAELGWRLTYSGWQDGLTALLDNQAAR